MLIFKVIPGDLLFNGDNANGLKADYYNNKDFLGNVLFSTIDKNVDVSWGDSAPKGNMDPNNFGVIWTGEFRPDHSGTFYLGVTTTLKTSFI